SALPGVFDILQCVKDTFDIVFKCSQVGIFLVVHQRGFQCFSRLSQGSEPAECCRSTHRMRFLACSGKVVHCQQVLERTEVAWQVLREHVAYGDIQRTQSLLQLHTMCILHRAKPSLCEICTLGRVKNKSYQRLVL